VQTLVDFADLLAATALLAVLLTLPGAAMAAWIGRYGAKEVKQSCNWGTALLFSFAVLPVLLSLVARLVSLDAAVAVQLVLAAAGIAAAGKMQRPPLLSVLGLLACALVVGLETIDFRFGGKLYQSTVALDMVKHVATVNSILSWGLPLTDPFVSRAQPAGYYYFFYTLAAVPVRLTKGAIDARASVGALAALDGAALLALAMLLWQKAEKAGKAGSGLSASRNVVLALIALLLCGNLDIVPSVAVAFAKHVWPIEIEWWNQQIAPWTLSLLWVPHHVLALVAGVFGLILIAERPGIPCAIAGGLAFASCAGVSAWIGLGTALTAAFWLISLICRKRYRLALTLVAAGCLAAVLLVPETLDILRGRANEGSPIAFTIRAFAPLDAMLAPGLAREVLRLLLLPVNYFFEFGIFAVGAVVYCCERRLLAAKTEAALILAFAAAAGVLLGTFTRSTLINNDLGWRVVLLPQLAFLIWSTAVILAHGAGGQFRLADSARWPSAMGALLVIGYVGNLYEFVSIRAYPILAPNIVLGPRIAIHPELDAELASAYGWADSHVPRNAILQHNPVAAPRVLDFGLYGRNRVAVADSEATLYGASKAEVDARLAAIGPIFTRPLAAAQVRARAAAEGIDVLVVSSADPIWSDRRGWVWSAPVLFASPHVRLIATRALDPEH
jgi:hypothetical protein